MESRARARKETCYYKILGISIRATQDEIRSAFRYLAMKLHPDRNPGNPGAAERFREVRKAYETLRDPAARGKYDRTRGYRKSKGKGYSDSSWTDLHQEGGEASSFEEIFQDLFGIGKRHFRTNRGCDLRFDLQVPRSALGNGGVHEDISYERVALCRSCNSVAGRAGCPVCGGSGEELETRSIRVWIPGDIRDGARIRVGGGGDQLYASVPAGDLILLIHVIEGL